jgi:hypothetical protein
MNCDVCITFEVITSEENENIDCGAVTMEGCVAASPTN